MVKDPVFAVYNRDLVSPAREDAYVRRSLDAMRPHNRHDPDALELINAAYTLVER